MGNNISYQTAEYGKFLQLGADTAFPPISVVRWSYPDTSSAFPENSAVKPLSSVDVYPKYAVLSHLTNPDDIKISLSAENINISLDGLENLTRIQNAISYIQSYQLSALTLYVDDLEKNTFDTASACDDSYRELIKLNTTTKILTTENLYGTLTGMPLYVTSTQDSPVLAEFADSVQLDPYSILKVSPTPQFWWQVASVDKDVDTRIVEKLTNGASSYFAQNIAAIVLTSGVSANGLAIRASRRRMKIRPGVTHQWTGIYNWNGTQAGCVKRLGLFTNYNGVFFELSASDFNVCARRRLPDGTLDENRVERANWNGDRLNGNGKSGQNWNTSLSAQILSAGPTIPTSLGGELSGANVSFILQNNQIQKFKIGDKIKITGIIPNTFNNSAVAIKSIDVPSNKITATFLFDPGTFSSVSNAIMSTDSFLKVHTFWIEFSGDKTNFATFGMYTSKGPVILHKFDFNDSSGFPFFSAPALMERREIFNFTVPEDTPSLTIHGTSFTVEPWSNLTPNFGTFANNTYLDFGSSVGLEHPILGIALRSGEPYQRAGLQIKNIQIMDLNNTGVGGGGANAAISSLLYWRLLLNPALSGEPQSINIAKSSRAWKYTTSTNILSSGIELMGGYAISTSSIDFTTSLNFLDLGSNIDYTDSDKIVLSVKLLKAGTNASQIIGSIDFQELL